MKRRKTPEDDVDLAGGERERDLLRQQTARHERKRARRRVVQPVRVINHGEEWLLLGGLGQQAEDRQPDQERIRRRPRTQSKRDAKRLAAEAAAGAPSAPRTANTAAEPPRTGAPSPPRPRTSGRSETRSQTRPRTRAARSYRPQLRHAPPTRRHARRARRPAAGRTPRARVPGRTTALLTTEPVATLHSFRLSMTRGRTLRSRTKEFKDSNGRR